MIRVSSTVTAWVLVIAFACIDDCETYVFNWSTFISSVSWITKLSISAVIISAYVWAFLPLLCVETSATGSYVYLVVGTIISSNSKICAPDFGALAG